MGRELPGRVRALVDFECVDLGIVARVNFPIPSRLEEGKTAPASGFTQSYWLFMVAGACFAAGLMSYELVAYHLAITKTISEHWIPALLAFSTGCGVIAS